MDEDWDDEHDDGDEDFITCPECGAETFADAEACSECGYWITDADRTAAWRGASAAGRIVTVGLWVIGVAAGGALALWLL